MGVLDDWGSTLQRFPADCHPPAERILHRAVDVEAPVEIWALAESSPP